ELLVVLGWGSKQSILPYIRWVKDDLLIPILYVSHAVEEATPPPTTDDNGKRASEGERPSADITAGSNSMIVDMD
ncbi:MAG: hypothetical protein MJA28_05590, partial [Gammaproteobacteria bacterium]|nr:hypothetical protein [Gammaproteobacteria bacterium]